MASAPSDISTAANPPALGSPTTPQSPLGRWLPRLIALLIFVAALFARRGIFTHVHNEGDERIYAALLDQLDAGRGYTLRGHPILDEGWLIREQYDTPLFYHPPAGITLFLLCRRAFGASGLGVAQLLSFAMFYWATLSLIRATLGRWTAGIAFVSGLLVAFTPIVTHVNPRYWLDGPQLGFASIAAALLVAAFATRRDGTTPSRTRMNVMCVLAGVAMGAACLTKLNAVMIIPGAMLLVLAITTDRSPRRLVPGLAIFCIVTALAVAPWLFIQWRETGAMFPTWAGKPHPRLVASNPWIHHVTVTFTPWNYLRMLPQVVWTAVPTLLLLALAWRLRSPRLRVSAALTAWVALIVAAHIVLGFVGYSKLLRYIILICPAMTALFVLLLFEAIAMTRDARYGHTWRRIILALVALGGIAWALEVAQGYKTLTKDFDRNLIHPLFRDAN